MLRWKDRGRKKKAGRGVSFFHFIPSTHASRSIKALFRVHAHDLHILLSTNLAYRDPDQGQTYRSRLPPKHINTIHSPSRVRPQGFVSQVTPPPIATCPLDRLRLNRDLDCTRDLRQHPASSCTAVASACNNNIHCLLPALAPPTNSTPL